MESLTNAVFEETRLLSENVQFQELPNLTAEEKFARWCETLPLPSKEFARSVIEEVFWASLLTEEGRPCRSRLIYSPRKKDRGQAAHWLEKPVPLNRDSLRKMTPAQGPQGYLIWDHDSGKPEITGIEGRQGGDVCDFTIASPNYGAIDINWSCFRIIALRAGSVDRRSKEFLPDRGGALDIVRRLLDSFDPVFLGHTISAIAREGHGGAVWILREGQQLNGIHIGHSVKRCDPPIKSDYQRRFKWLDSVGNLAGIDGAVLLDSRLRVLGFGCFIDISEAPREVLRVTGLNRVQSQTSETLGGGRHRSAIEFCYRFAPAAAIVVSEDGRISISWAAADKVLYWAPFSILGFSDELNVG